jgi:iron complex outermembrane receptor protein
MMGKSILKKIILITLINCTGFVANVLAEEAAGSSYEQLGDITVSATRVDKSLYEIPASVGYVGIDDIQLGTQQLGLDEGLDKIPGLFMTNRYNFNQDLRISIRGFGSRATFGIRGIKLYVDGIPATTPDGQGGVDHIDIGSTGHIEVVRGPSSSIYGSASGGVINVYTEDGPVDAPFLEGRFTLGSDSLKKLQVKTGGQKGPLNYLVNLSRLDLKGYRFHSETDNVLLNSKFRYDIDSTSDLTITANAVDSPEANDPGGLCSSKSASAFCTTFEADPTVAQGNNVRYDAGESVAQQQLGLIYRKQFGDKHEITARNYYVLRDFNANLPTGAPFISGGIIALERFFVGGGLQYSLSDQVFGHRNRLTVGFDIDSQMDERKNFQNNRGAPSGPLSLNQDEDVFSWGVYLQNEFDITDTLGLSFGIRYDEVEYEFTDYFLTDADQSGSSTFKEWSPQAGLLWKLHDAINFYGNVSTSFETPSTREFASVTGPGGFNTSLNAQTATNYEVGIKGLLPGNASYQLSLFTIDVSDELLPAGENLGGSTFFVNAGETERTGLEAGMTFRPLPGLDVSLTYTYSDFEFETLMVAGTSFSGEKIPGVPEHVGFMEIAYNHPSGLFSIFDIQYVDEVFVNNAYIDAFATVIPQGEAADDYALANFRMGYIAHTDGNIEFTPFFGINNLFNQKYMGNVRVNEARHRYFDPAPELNVYAGVSVRYQ